MPSNCCLLPKVPFWKKLLMELVKQWMETCHLCDFLRNIVFEQARYWQFVIIATSGWELRLRGGGKCPPPFLNTWACPSLNLSALIHCYYTQYRRTVVDKSLMTPKKMTLNCVNIVLFVCILIPNGLQRHSSSPWKEVCSITCSLNVTWHVLWGCWDNPHDRYKLIVLCRKVQCQHFILVTWLVWKKLHHRKHRIVLFFWACYI